MQKQLIIAHRGESFIAPENTLSAINLAWQNNADAVEIDIRLTKDNQIVVIHDTNTIRVARRLKWIKYSTLNNLKKIDVGKYKNKKYKGEQIPILQEVLNTVPNDKKILIEIKSGRKIIPSLKEVISNSGLQVNQIEIISFKLEALIEIRKQLPEFSVFLISELDYYLYRRIFKPSINKLISKAINNNLNGLDLWSGQMLNDEIIKKIKSSGLKLYTWTVNNPEKANALLEMGVDGITTDRAKWLKNLLISKI